MQQETVIVLDFGGQYNQLIARRVRENAMSTARSIPTRTDLCQNQGQEPQGHHLHRRPQQRLPAGFAHRSTPRSYNWGVPILGICYGSQLMMHMLGGKVCTAHPSASTARPLVDVDNRQPAV